MSRCKNCDLPRNRHLPYKVGTMVVVAEPSVPGWRKACRQFTRDPLWIRALAWLSRRTVA